MGREEDEDEEEAFLSEDALSEEEEEEEPVPSLEALLAGDAWLDIDEGEEEEEG